MGYPGNRNSNPSPSLQRQGEKLQGLVGDRGAGREEKLAVTREDAAKLGTLQLLSANAAGAAPTAAEHNALVTDLRALAAVLNAMGAKITWS